jgi:hypothetical protein
MIHLKLTEVNKRMPTIERRFCGPVAPIENVVNPSRVINIIRTYALDIETKLKADIEK